MSAGLTWADMKHNMDVETPNGRGVVWGRSTDGSKALVWLRGGSIKQAGKLTRTPWYKPADLRLPGGAK